MFKLHFDATQTALACPFDAYTLAVNTITCQLTNFMNLGAIVKPEINLNVREQLKVS